MGEVRRDLARGGALPEDPVDPQPDLRSEVSIEGDRLDVELALLACQWYGTAVLQSDEA